MKQVEENITTSTSSKSQKTKKSSTAGKKKSSAKKDSTSKKDKKAKKLPTRLKPSIIQPSQPTLLLPTASSMPIRSTATALL